MGVTVWLHDQATLPQGKNSSHHSWCGHIMQMCCPHWVWVIRWSRPWAGVTKIMLGAPTFLWCLKISNWTSLI